MLSFPCGMTTGVALFILCHGIHSADAASAPSTLPAVRQWTAGSGTCVFGASSRIVVNSGDAEALSADAETFADDVCGLFGRAVTVTNAATMGPGDVFLKLGVADDTIGDEGYRLSITTGFEISANTPAGVFYGTRTMLQLLKQGTTISRGTIVDRPAGRWRGVMVDAGRKYYTVEWLQALIRDMAYVKMNLFHFHLSDGLSTTNNGGFRLQSIAHPEITSTQHYSRAEIQSLLTLAAKYHVTIVPEIDFPGHVNWLYTAHRNVLLGSRVLDNQYWALDLSKDSAYTLVRDILDEFIPLFPGPFWHLGADEYMFIDEFASFPQLASWARNRYGVSAHANDCYRHFINRANEIIKSHGKTTWAWNDVLLGIAGAKVGACTLATDIWIDHWAALDWIGWGGVSPSAERSLGYNMINCSWDIYYIITANDKTTGDPQWVYDNWALNVFAGGKVTAGDPHIKGGKFPIWGDVPAAETEAQVWRNTFMLSRAVAQECWGSHKTQAGYSGFKTLGNAIGRAPMPVVTVNNNVRTSFPRRGLQETVQLFDLRGALVATVSAEEFSRGGGPDALLRQIAGTRPMCASPCIYRLRGKGIDETALIVLIR
ncbi:MAG: family 20 glycosylhydrolase [Chitinispirillaceae bacterium]|nr:family 20 glycosylhydrolase [Chitinispirillaceae bacterium]